MQIANNIYAELAQNVLTTAATVSATTVASATYVIMQQMELSKTKPKAAEPDNIAKAISKKLNAVSVSRARTIARLTDTAFSFKLSNKSKSIRLCSYSRQSQTSTC